MKIVKMRNNHKTTDRLVNYTDKDNNVKQRREMLMLHKDDNSIEVPEFSDIVNSVGIPNPLASKLRAYNSSLKVTVRASDFDVDSDGMITNLPTTIKCSSLELAKKQLRNDKIEVDKSDYILAISKFPHRLYDVDDTDEQDVEVLYYRKPKLASVEI